MNPAGRLQRYFAETMEGDLSAVDRYFAPMPDYVLIGEERPELRELMPWVGRQRDREGIKRAYGMLLDAIEVLQATPEALFAEGEHVAAFGRFRYRARRTGKTAESAWAAHAVVRGDQIVTYRFYEDSHGVAEALRPG